ncbi:MAG: hypothetical protein AAF355_15130 [Myxococcota bacterium]
MTRAARFDSAHRHQVQSVGDRPPRPRGSVCLQIEGMEPSITVQVAYQTQRSLTVAQPLSFLRIGAVTQDEQGVLRTVERVSIDVSRGVPHLMIDLAEHASRLERGPQLASCEPLQQDFGFDECPPSERSYRSFEEHFEPSTRAADRQSTGHEWQDTRPTLPFGDRLAAQAWGDSQEEEPTGQHSRARAEAVERSCQLNVPARARKAHAEALRVASIHISSEISENTRYERLFEEDAAEGDTAEDSFAPFDEPTQIAVRQSYWTGHFYFFLIRCRHWFASAWCSLRGER